MSTRRFASPITAAVAAVLFITGAARGQANPVYVDDSPRAWELFNRAVDQARDNTGEAVRLFQELLDDYDLRLIPISDAAQDHFVSVRTRVLRELAVDPGLLERYRLIETPRARRLLESGELGTVARTRMLTPPGLEALLRLAQRDLESARFRSAARWLREAADHPDLTGRDAVQCWLMLGMASHYLDEIEEYERALAELAGTGPGGQSARQQLQRLAAVGARPRIDRGITVMDTASASDLTDLVAQEIWSAPLEDSLLNRRFIDPTSDTPPRSPAFERRRAEADLTTGAATVAGPVVYVNEGYTVRAVNRLTGRELWRYIDQPKLAVIDRDSDQTMDLNIVSVAEDALVTLTGHATLDGRSSHGRVICLEPASGDLRWSRSLDRIGGLVDHAGLFPHGTPVIEDGRVYVLARKISRQLLTSCYVVALDLDTGGLAWARHIASSGGVRRSGRSFSTVTLDAGDLYLSTAVGAIARVEVVTGDIVWLQRFNVPISPTSHDQERRPWEISSPAITPRGVIAMHPDQRWVALLDRDAGDLLESHASVTRDGWSSPSYLLANDHFVYAVGREIRAFSLDMLDVPLWQLPAQPEPDGDGQPVASAYTRLPIRGRVQLVDGALIVPTLNGVLVVDDETGQVVHRVSTQTIGNPLAVDAQLIVAGGDRLDAYMSFHRAERLLRERIASSPQNPEPALSMLRLGLRVRDLTLVLESAALAMDAIDLAPTVPENRTARIELFDTLQAVTEERILDTTAEGEALFAMMGQVAVEPEQRVEHLLVYGDWLLDHDVARALETYQQVLSDTGLAAVWRGEAGAIQPAGAWAAARLGALIRGRGPQVYAPLADYAQLQLDQLMTGDTPAPETLLALAAEFPFARAAVEATFLAAETLAGRGDMRTAIGVLSAGCRLTEDPPSRGLLLGRAVEMCLDAGFDDQADRLLDVAADIDPPLLLATAGATRSAAEWRAERRRGQSMPAAARVGDNSGAARVLESTRLVPAHPGGDGRFRPDRAMLVSPTELTCLDAATLESVWTAPVDSESPQLLRMDERDVVLWYGNDKNDPRAVRLDADTGHQAWITPRIRDHVGDSVGDLSRARDVQEQLPNGEPFDPGESIPLLGSDSLVVVQRTGGVVAVGLADGQVRWALDRTLTKVHLAVLHDYGLILAGTDRRVDTFGDAERLPYVLVIDPRTGRTVHEIRPRGRTGVIWMTVTPLGELACGTAEGIEFIDLLAGDRRLANVSYAAMGSRQGWMTSDGLVVKDRVSALRAVDLATGTLSEPFAAPTRGEWDPLDFRELTVTEDGFYARYKQRLVSFAIDGSVLGADVINDERDYRWVLPTADRLLLISGRVDQTLIPDRDGRRTLHVYRIYSLSGNCKLLAEPLEFAPLPKRVEEIAVVNGWLLLSTPVDTVALPMGRDNS